MTHATLTHTSSCRPLPAHRGGLTGLIFALTDLWRSRQVLGDLDAERLADLGLSAQEAAAEARRAPWHVPKHWLK